MPHAPSLVLISTTPATPGDRGLPPPTEDFVRFGTAEVDWADPESVIEYLVGYSRVLNGNQRPSMRQLHVSLVRRDNERRATLRPYKTTTCSQAKTNHRSHSSTNVPTLVIHGTADPMFPLSSTLGRWRRRSWRTLLAIPGAGTASIKLTGPPSSLRILEHTLISR